MLYAETVGMNFCGTLKTQILSTLFCLLCLFFIALNGFAQLMGLEDSASVPAENEGLDSGLGDVPPTSDKKTTCSTDNLEPETANVGKNVTLTRAAKSKRQSVKPEKSKPRNVKKNQEENNQQNVRKSSRKKQKKDLEPDKILEQKKRKSLEKVAEWLLKVPAEDELELEKPIHSTDDSDSRSCTEMVDIQPQDVEFNPKREDRAKALEEQVFGAVYKRRGSKVIEPLTGKEIQTSKRLSKLRKTKNFGFSKERQMVEKDTDIDFFKELEQMEVVEKFDKNEEEMNERESDQYQGEHEVPVAEIVQPETRQPTRSTCNSLQQLDSDLQKLTEFKSKGTEEKSDQRKGKSSKSSTKKSANVAKPLVMVAVQNRETSPKPNKRSKEVEVQIESYPSSEDQTTPVMKSTRRSRRLQLFVEEVQGSHKKTTSASSTTKRQTEEANGETIDAILPKNGTPKKEVKRNGCVHEDDIGGIESIENCGRASSIQAEAEVPEAPNLAKAVTDCSVSVVPNSTSPTDPSIVGPTIESEKQENNRPPDSQHETCVNEANGTVEEYKDGKDDSELDTEQLLRSFKAAKRKSFHLGKPNVKRSRLDEENAEESHPKCSGSELSNDINQVSKETEKSISSDVISPSNSPIHRRKSVQEVLEISIPKSDCSGQDVGVENCPSRSSFSSGLSPNKVSKRDRESPLSVVPQVVDSGLRLTPVGRDASKCSQIPDGQGDSKHCLVNKGETIFIAESSLTPDGLDAPAGQGILEANGSGEVSNQSSTKISPRRKRRTQRLESTSESDSSSSKEELPTLAQIFGPSDHPLAEIKDREEVSEANRIEGLDAGQSPDQLDSSQASVDLFGTPDDCK